MPRQTIIHLHSSGTTNNSATAPSSSAIEYGEIAVNYNAGNETLFIKNSSNEIVSFTPSGSGPAPELSVITAGTGNAITGLTASGMQLTANLGEIDGLPVVTSSDNNKVLKVVEGDWAVVSAITVYTGSGEPSSDLGQDGDIYLNSGGSSGGHPHLRMVWNNVNYNHELLLPFNQYVTSRIVHFYVDGEIINELYINSINDESWIEPETDTETDERYATFLSSNGTKAYLVEAYIDGSNDPITGMVYCVVFEA